MGSRLWVRLRTMSINSCDVGTGAIWVADQFRKVHIDEKHRLTSFHVVFILYVVKLEIQWWYAFVSARWSATFCLQDAKSTPLSYLKAPSAPLSGVSFVQLQHHLSTYRGMENSRPTILCATGASCNMSSGVRASSQFVRPIY